jgi:hypothetical protein
LLANLTVPLALQPGQAVRQDYEYKRNAKKASIRWNFTVDDARIVFKDHYPTSLAC